jgi:hypothetical protein
VQLQRRAITGVDLILARVLVVVPRCGSQFHR